MIGRVVLTAIWGMFYTAFQWVYTPVASLMLGEAAGNQFANSDGTYYQFNFINGVISHLNGIALGIFLIGLFFIWIGALKKGFTYLGTLSIIVIGLMLYDTPSYAYYATTDIAEAYTILPNESAFWIPDQGANKDSQKAFDSEDYLNSAKIAAKRFIVPHAKFSNSGGWVGFDSYVPTGRLIIVDRTTYSKEWVDSTTRGSSKNMEGFPCQSKEGLNITAGVSIAASVSDNEDAAKFLYHFGVTPPQGDRKDPQVIFTSVYYGRKLESVMDDVIRKKVQTLVCNEFGARTFDEGNSQINAILVTVEKNARDYMKSVGITLEFIGWADTLAFDPEVQKAVNDKYVADKLASSREILQALGNIKIQEGVGTGIDKHGLPVVLPPGFIDGILGIIKSPLTPAIVPTGK